MADITRRFFLRHLRGEPTTFVRHTVRGRVRHEGVGQSFWYRPLTAVLSEVPVDGRELPLLFHARTADFADVTVQATVTYRLSDPGLAAERLDFAIDPQPGEWRGQPLDQVATLLAELAQQPALDLLSRLERSRLAAETERAKDSARADGVRAVGLASAESEAARLTAYREMPQIGELTITPDVVTKLLGRFS